MVRVPGRQLHVQAGDLLGDEAYRDEMVATARQEIAAMVPDRSWMQWAAHLAPTITIAAITAWPDAGQPDPETAAKRIRQTVVAVVDAACRPPAS
ncbi:hypothetical protein [Kocuria flava]|uniref:hypothetical protein n=1 Tax=Kocuria flava TaxID=446860 RepID=UPI00146FEB04|nr:hypothetical protein [Kocuria flava]